MDREGGMRLMEYTCKGTTKHDTRWFWWFLNMLQSCPVLGIGFPQVGLRLWEICDQCSVYVSNVPINLLSSV